jgi:hypothetical protein
MRWSGCWITSFPEGPHMDGWRSGERAARVVSLRQVADIPVMPNRSGRKRPLYLAMVCLRGEWTVVGVYGSSRSAKRWCERTLEEATS